MTVIPNFNRGYYYNKFIGHLFSFDPLKDARKALAAAQDLQKQGKLEAARLRYQQTLGLQGAVLHENTDGTVRTAVEAIATLTEKINQKRAEAQPRLNRRLDIVVRNQPLDEAIRAVVEAGGFQLELISGSLEDTVGSRNLQELRETYLDLRPATVWQGLELLIAPYRLTWRVTDADTITVGTTRRFPMPSSWGYAVADLLVPLEQEIGAETVEKRVTTEVKTFLKGIRTITGQKTDSILTPGSAMLIDFGLLVVYGEPDTHEKVQAFITALRDGRMDVLKVAGRKLPSKDRAFLKTLQTRTIARWKSRAGARKKEARQQTLRRVDTHLEIAPWQLLAEAIRGGVDLEALATLQIAWDNPHIKKADSERVMRSAWCISAAAQAVPTNTELVALSEKVLSTVRDIQIRKPRHGAPSEYLAALYAGLVSQNCVSASSHPSEVDALSSQVDGVMRLLAEVRKNDELWITRIIAEALRSRSVNKERRLLTALLAHEIRGDDHVLLTSLIAKRRGGQLWDTFRQEMPDIVGQQPLNGHVVVALNRLEASELTFLPE